MYAQVEKKNDNKCSTVANNVGQKKSDLRQSLGFIDSRLETVEQRKLHEIVDNIHIGRDLVTSNEVHSTSFAIQHKGKIDHIKAREHIIQLKKKKKGVEVAENEDEATRLMSEYASSIGLSWDGLPADLKELAVRHAQDPDEGGIDSGQRLIFSEKQNIVQAQKKKARSDYVKEDYDKIRDEFSDDLALSAFNIAHATYVGGASINAGIAGEFSSSEFYSAKHDWDKIGNYETISNFHSFAPQDKAAQGKGNVGDTLDTRKVQGNLLCCFGLTKINVHVNIK